MKKQIHNLSYLRAQRKELRNHGTSAEVFLWKYLSGSKLQGKKFRRQHSILNYIVDFYCSSEKIIIELDGRFHFEVGGQIKDEERDRVLRSIGFTVLHFENDVVFNSIETVLAEIEKHFKM